MADKNPAAIVTGSSSGMGAATAVKLAALSWNVVVNAATSAKDAEAVARQCEKAGGKAMVVLGDVSSDADCKRIAAQFRSEGEGRSAEILGTMEKELRQIRSTAYRRVQEIRGKSDAEATRVYGSAYGRDPEFYAFSRTLEAYKEGQNKNSVMILTTDSDYYRYLKDSTGRIPGSSRTAR